jgi:putative nucleotidyltransferase with HDIG domain
VSSPTVSAHAPAAARRDLIPHYAWSLIAVTAVVAALSDFDRIGDSPVVFGLLLALIVALDRVRINLFERAKTSPATVPAIVLACLFGPLGPIFGEVAIMVTRRKTPLIGRLVDFGFLSLSGVAAAGVYAALPERHGAALMAVSGLAGLAYYAVNSVGLGVIWRLHEGIGALEAWLERMAWLWPHNIAAGLVAGLFVVGERSIGTSAFLIFFLPLAMSWLTQKQYLDRSRSSVEQLRRSHSELERTNAQLQGLLERSRANYLSTISSLARTIEAKDPYTGGHTERVGEYALMLARELGFGEDELEAVEVGAIVHDIGKIGIPDRILLKPGRLDAEEFAEMRKHPEISSYILDGLDVPQVVVEMARHHHERFDGNGYPDGLAGEDIPLAARILTVADAFDAMTSDRPYRAALAVEEALAEVRRNAGTQFCPAVVAALDACFAGQPRA